MPPLVANPRILPLGGWFLAITFCLLGLLSTAAALFGWQWFFNTASAGILANSIGMKATRLLYGIMGMGVTAMGIFMIFYLLDN